MTDTLPARTVIPRPRQAGDTAVRTQRILVIGGAGFVGTVLVRALLARGFGVTVMDALVYGDEGLGDLYADERFDVVKGDIRDIEAVVRAMKGMDAVVHLGGLVGDPACALDEETTLDINMRATTTLALVARGMGIKRFVFASSCSIYGASDGILDEESELAPVSVYARSKMESELTLQQMADDEFAPVILRFGTFFGLSHRPRFDLVANLLVAKALDDGEITVFGGGQWRPFLHVEDGAEAVIRCLDADADLVRGQVFNVGGDSENHTLEELGRLVEAEVPGSRLVLGDAATVEANYRVSFAKISGRLGFVPRRTLADGIHEIRTAIESGGLGDYAEARYSNIKALTLGGAAEKLSNPSSVAVAEIAPGA